MLAARRSAARPASAHAGRFAKRPTRNRREAGRHRIPQGNGPNRSGGPDRSRTFCSIRKQAQRSGIVAAGFDPGRKARHAGPVDRVSGKGLDLELWAGFQPAEGSRGQIVNLPPGSEVVDLPASSPGVRPGIESLSGAGRRDDGPQDRASRAGPSLTLPARIDSWRKSCAPPIAGGPSIRTAPKSARPRPRFCKGSATATWLSTT